MKKVLLLMIGILVLSIGIASAEGGPVNPYFSLVNNMPAPANPYMRSSNGINVAFNDKPFIVSPHYYDPSNPDNPTVIEVPEATGGKGKYEYKFWLVDPSVKENDNPGGDPITFQNWSSNRSFSFDLVVAGSYQVWVYVKDSSMPYNLSSYPSASFAFKMNEDKNHPSIDTIVRNLVNQCIEEGCDTDYKKALWLHDWLTENANYDYTYSYYSADGVLARGTGVCDSYCKAYMRLLKEAEIDVARVTSTYYDEEQKGDVGHAWNLVKLGGKWYQVDTTWDDVTVFDKEGRITDYVRHHYYFGITDELIKVDHPDEDNSYDIWHNNSLSDITCTDLEYNYFIQSGKSSMWTTDELKASVLASLKSEGYLFNADLPDSIDREIVKYILAPDSTAHAITAYALSKLEWQYTDATTGNTQDLILEIVYDMENERFNGEIVFEDTYVMQLPTALTNINASAFTGDKTFMSVVIPENVEKVEANAFSGCSGLWKVIVEGSNTIIDDSAFTGSDNITIICKADSEAKTFADNNSIRVETTIK